MNHLVSRYKWGRSSVAASRCLALSILMSSVAAFISPSLSRSSIIRHQKWGLQVHSSTVPPVSSDFCFDDYPREFYEMNLPLDNEMASSDVFDRDSNIGSDLTGLCKLLDATPVDLLRLQMTSDGVRGLFLNRSVKEGDVILSIPLTSCLSDESSPSWLRLDDPDHTISWATRIGANLLDLQLRIENNPETKHALWVSLLPDSEHLKASLPVHWEDDTVLGTKSTALELAVDSAFFARAEATDDLLASLRDSDMASTKSEEQLRNMCSNALDVVQTRSCRLEASSGSPIRVLAPIFDFMNHGSLYSNNDSGANVHYDMETTDERRNLVVRATSDLERDEEVLVDYGDSARPAWKCLLSYGFVPDFKADSSADDNDDESSNGDYEDLAEVFIDGIRYEVGSSFIPFEIVEKMAAKLHVGTRIDNLDEPELALTPEIAQKISQRISEVAYHLLLEPESDFYDDHPTVTPSPFQVISSRLSSSLRWHQHRVLLACAKGLQEFVSDETG